MAFAETKEQLAGFYMVEARDLNEALTIAAGIPAARVAASRCGRYASWMCRHGPWQPASVDEEGMTCT